MDSQDKNKKTFKNKTYLASFEFAFQGFKTVFKEERNMRTHSICAGIAIAAGAFFRLSKAEWLWLLLAVFLVIVMEIINTSFENVIDLVTHQHFDPIGKKVKDMAAAAVLFTAGFAVIVGCIIFLPKIGQLITSIGK